MNKDIVSTLISGVLLILLGISCTWQIISVTEKALYLSLMGEQISPAIIDISGPFYNYSKRGGRYNKHYLTVIRYLNQDGELSTPNYPSSINTSIVYAKKYPKLYMNSTQGRGFFDLIFQQYDFWEVVFFITVASVSLCAGCFLLTLLYRKHILQNQTNAS